MTANDYLHSVLYKYQARNLSDYANRVARLESVLQSWAHTCFVELLISGSRAKGTAISLASDLDIVVSLTPECQSNNGGLRSIYESLLSKLQTDYSTVRKQNVSVRVTIADLEVDVTPARKQSATSNYHSIWLSKHSTWRQTNIQKHISDISQSGRLNEIKLLKIWRELNGLDFPSIYLEYLLVQDILSGRSKSADSLSENLQHTFFMLASTTNNPLNRRIVDPANSNNVLSDLMTETEKNHLHRMARSAAVSNYWSNVIF